MTQYRIKDQAPPHYIGNRIVGPGEVVTLADGVAPGVWLEPVAEAKEPAETPPAPTKAKGKGAKVPEPDQQADAPVDTTEGEF